MTRFCKNQAQCIFSTVSIFHQRSNIPTVINIALMLFVFLVPILNKTHKMLYWFCVIYASSSFVLSRFPFFSNVVFDDSFILKGVSPLASSKLSPFLRRSVYPVKEQCDGKPLDLRKILINWRRRSGLRQLMHRQLNFSFFVGLTQQQGLYLKKSDQETLVCFLFKLECISGTDSVYIILGFVKTIFEPFFNCTLSQ